MTEYIDPCPVCGGGVEDVERDAPEDFVEWALMTEEARDALLWRVLPCGHVTSERPTEKLTHRRYWDDEEWPIQRTEWRVVGEPGHGYPSYSFTFESEEQARGFVRMVDDRTPWEDGPHLEARTVAETPWERQL